MKTPPRPWCSIPFVAWRLPLYITLWAAYSILFISGCGFQFTFYDFNGDPIGKPKAKPRMVEEVIETYPEQETSWNSYTEHVEFVKPVEAICWGPVITIIVDKPRRRMRCGNEVRSKNPCIRYEYRQNRYRNSVD